MLFFMDIATESTIFNNIIRTFFGFLCKIIYPMIVNVWDLFMALAKTQIFNSSLEDGGIVSTLYARVGLLLGILMLFRVIFSLIQMLINPELLTDKDKGFLNIIKKAFLVIVLLAFTPTIFSAAFKVQQVIIEENTIGNIVFGKNVSNMDEFGGTLASNLFRTFYVITPEFSESNKNLCKPYELIFLELRDYRTLNLIDECLTLTEEKTYNFGESEGLEYGSESKDIYVIEFGLNGFLAVAVGGAIFWIILVYCIYLGARVVQLALLQIIAPIPIISYLSPGKNDSLIKWAKLCVSTFLDLFLRLAIIYFIALIISLMFDTGSEGLEMIANTSGATDSLLTFVKIAIILGALMVAKKLPDVIGEVFPSLGVGKGKLGFGVSWKKMTEGMIGGKAIYGVTSFGARAATVGAAGAAVGGAVGFLGRKGVGKIGGTLSGIGRGFSAGSKKGGPVKNLGNAFHSQSAANRSYAEWKAAGGVSSISRFKSGIQKKFGLNTSYNDYQEQIESKKAINEKSKSRASSARSSYSAFDTVANTGKDAKRAAKSFESIGVNGANYLANKGLTAKLAAAGITVGPNESFASILERSKSTKERLEAKVTSIDASLLELGNKKLEAQQKFANTTDRAEKQRLAAEIMNINAQEASLNREKSASIDASEKINLGEIEKAVGEARMGEFLAGNVKDGKASGEFDIAMSTAETVIDNLRNTGNGQNDADANVLQEYITAVQNVKNSRYDFATQGSITVDGNTYNNAYDLYDAMVNKAQEIANNTDAEVRKQEEELRKIQTSEGYIRARADDQHSGGKK